MKKVIKLVSLLLFLFTLFSCDNAVQNDSMLSFGDADSGIGITITLPGSSKRSADYFGPDDAASYTVQILKGDDVCASKNGLPGETVTLKVAEEGTYDIKVSAYSQDNVLIAEGTTTKELTRYQGVIPVKVSVNPKKKSIEIEVGVEWGEPDYSSGKKIVLNVWSYTDELSGMVKKYVALHPDCKIEVNETIISTATTNEYLPNLDNALQVGGKDAPDIYAAEQAFVLKYTKGDMSSFAMPYKDLGIDLNQIEEAGIAPFITDIGSTSQGVVNALSYDGNTACFIYRRSLAKTVFGTDDPAVINEKIGGGSGKFNAFFEAAAECKEKNIAILSGIWDFLLEVENSADESWVKNGKLYIDPKREALLDYTKTLKDNGYTNMTTQWRDPWFDDMGASGNVLGFFGPTWFLNYTMPHGENSAAGDWAVCSAPVNYFHGGTWILVNNALPASKKNAVKKIIEWITLDTSTDGLMYKWASGTYNGAGGPKSSVASSVVMAKADGTSAFLGGQNMFDYYIPANQTRGNLVTEWDESVNMIFNNFVYEYANGTKTREEALAAFKQDVKTRLGLSVSDGE